MILVVRRGALGGRWVSPLPFAVPHQLRICPPAPPPASIQSLGPCQNVLTLQGSPPSTQGRSVWLEPTFLFFFDTRFFYYFEFSNLQRSSTTAVPVESLTRPRPSTWSLAASESFRRSSMAEEPPTKRKCLGAGCENEATSLQCPKCLALGIKDSYFCSQECFKKNWVG